MSTPPPGPGRLSCFGGLFSIGSHPPTTGTASRLPPTPRIAPSSAVHDERGAVAQRQQARIPASSGLWGHFGSRVPLAAVQLTPAENVGTPALGASRLCGAESEMRSHSIRSPRRLTHRWFSAGPIGVQRPPESRSGPAGSCSSCGRQQPMPSSARSVVHVRPVPSSESEVANALSYLILSTASSEPLVRRVMAFSLPGPFPGAAVHAWARRREARDGDARVAGQSRSDRRVVAEALPVVERRKEDERLGAIGLQPAPQHTGRLQQAAALVVAAICVGRARGARYADGALLVHTEEAVARRPRQPRPQRRAAARRALHRTVAIRRKRVPERAATPAGIVGVRLANLHRAERAVGTVEELVDRALAHLPGNNRTP